MKKIMLFCLTACLSCFALAEDDACDNTVDMADSLDFSKLHIECSNDPVTLYDPNSKGSFLSKKKKAVTTYDKPATKTESVFLDNKSVESRPVASSQESVVEEIAEMDNAGVIFNIREPFTITGGPQSALNGLFVQMAQYCPKGWTKNQEWVEPSESGYFLHYQFQCAK